MPYHLATPPYGDTNRTRTYDPGVADQSLTSLAMVSSGGGGGTRTHTGLPNGF